MELKSCPFCGEATHLLTEHLEGTIIHPAYRIRCDNCGASTGYTDKDCRSDWNTRAQAAEIEALKEATKVLNAIDPMAVLARAQKAEAEIEALRAEVGRLQRQLRQAHKDYGCELRDPNGTIWEYAAAQKARAERLAEALDIIARVGKASRKQSTRTRWIVARAISALNGNDDWQEMPRPKGFHDALLRDQEEGK